MTPNGHRVLDYIIDGHYFGMTQASKDLNMSHTTIQNYLNILIKEGYIERQTLFKPTEKIKELIK